MHCSSHIKKAVWVKNDFPYEKKNTENKIIRKNLQTTVACNMRTSTYLISTLPPCQKNAPPVTSTPFWKLRDLLHLNNNQRHSNCRNCSVQDFNRSWQSVLRRVIRPFVTGYGKSGEDHAAGTLASPSLLLLYKSLSAQASSSFHEEWLIDSLLYGMRHSMTRLMYFKLQTNTSILLKIHLLAF